MWPPLLLNPGDGPGAQPTSDGTFSKVWGTSASQKTVENLWFELVIVTSLTIVSTAPQPTDIFGGQNDVTYCCA